MPTVNVKWQKEKYSVDVDLSQPPILFKTQLFTLTQVVPERQKVMISGKTLGDDSWEGFTIKDNMMLMMMGSTGEIPKAPTQNTEGGASSSEATQEEANAYYPVGLVNIGNTCYFNSCAQVLKEIKELALNPADHQKFQENQKMSQLMSSLVTYLRDKKKAFAAKGEAYTPLAHALALTLTFPQFEPRKQQDANECFTGLLNVLSNDYKRIGVDIEKYFTVNTSTTLKCLESDEVADAQPETHKQLSCFINQDVRFIQTGIKAGFAEEMEKNSEKLGRTAKWQKQTEITRLPKYLSVAMSRFFYKESSRTNAKILKSVQFPISFDAYDMCTQELKDKLHARRADIKLEEDAKLERELRKKTLDKEQAAKIMDDGVDLSTEFEDDAGTNNSGFYELKAVISHKGRASTDGHYVAWVKSGEDGKWRLFDDENVTLVSEEDILKTSGGGDWHSAYVLVYEARVIKKYPELPPAPVVSVDAAEPMEVSHN